MAGRRSPRESRGWSRVVGWLGPDRSAAERSAIFAAASVVGPTFEPGLQPRGTVHQAIATGIVSAATLGGVTLAQSTVDALGRVVTRGRADSASDAMRLAIGVGVNAGAAVATLGVARVLAPRPDEPLRRGLLRVAAERVGRTAILTTAVTAVTGGIGLVAEHSPRWAWLDRVPLALPAGLAVAAIHISGVRAADRAAGVPPMTPGARLPALGLAVGVGVGVSALQIGERATARGVAAILRRVAPGAALLAAPTGHLIALGGLGFGLIAAYEYVIRRVEQGGAAIEPAYREAPASPWVSGGPGSTVSFESLSREGRRFVNMALDRAEIEGVMGEPALADPVRVFIGLAVSPEIEDRVDAAMDELERTGAFDRSVLCLASPTGSGYVNYVMTEALEYLTRGDCATVTMQYSLLPSFLSLDRARLGIEQNRSLLHALSGYLRGRPPERRPRFVLFGESLGAQTLLDVYRHRPVAALDRDYVADGLFLGSPAATEVVRAWRADPARVDPEGAVVEVDSIAEFDALPAERRERARFVLVTHHDDPIPKFGPALLVRRPDWLGEPDGRPPGIPRSTTWHPLTTFILTGIDLLNAMDVVPGEFGRRGHDYREDIPGLVARAFRLPVTEDQAEAIEGRLRERERQWAQRRVVAEQMARAVEAVARELDAWGVSLPEGTDPGEVVHRLLEPVTRSRP